MIVIFMGISGSGKTTLGKLVAERLGIPFVEGDDYHSPENVAKMAAGHPLSSKDRQPWLASLADAMQNWTEQKQDRIVSCSALRKQYRDSFRKAAPGLRFVFLDGSVDLVRQRMQQRENHFMPAALVESQIAALEEPVAEADVIRVDIARPTEENVEDIINKLRPTLPQSA